MFQLAQNGLPIDVLRLGVPSIGNFRASREYGRRPSRFLLICDR
jgi:hypothetical protein